jgi:hypothetical protein
MTKGDLGMPFLDFRKCGKVLVVLMALASSGCGEKSAPPKTDLSEQEKEQIKDLNEQRTQEWGPKKK